MNNDLPTIKLRLAEAEYAYHQLMTGQATVIIKDQNSEMVQYNAASAARLATYINYLRDLVAQLSGGNGSNVGPMGFVF